MTIYPCSTLMSEFNNVIMKGIWEGEKEKGGEKNITYLLFLLQTKGMLGLMQLFTQNPPPYWCY